MNELTQITLTCFVQDVQSMFAEAFNNSGCGWNAEVFGCVKKYPSFKLIEDYYDCVSSYIKPQVLLRLSNLQLSVSVFFVVPSKTFFGVTDFIPQFQW